MDQFNQPKIFDLSKPTRLCIAADKNHEGVKAPDTHLMCYQALVAKNPPRQPKHVKVLGIFVNNQFGPEQLDTVKEDELCVPSEIRRTVP